MALLPTRLTSGQSGGRSANLTRPLCLDGRPPGAENDGTGSNRLSCGTKAMWASLREQGRARGLSR